MMAFQLRTDNWVGVRQGCLSGRGKQPAPNIKAELSRILRNKTSRICRKSGQQDMQEIRPAGYAANKDSRMCRKSGQENIQEIRTGFVQTKQKGRGQEKQAQWMWFLWTTWSNKLALSSNLTAICKSEGSWALSGAGISSKPWLEHQISQWSVL